MALAHTPVCSTVVKARRGFALVYYNVAGDSLVHSYCSAFTGMRFTALKQSFACGCERAPLECLLALSFTQQ